MRRAFVFAFLLVTTTALAQTPSSSAGRAGTTPDPAIVKIADAYVQASLASDAKAIAALYTEDAVEMPPNQPLVKGRAAIEQHYTKLFADGAAKMSGFTLEHLDSVSSGNIGYDVGTYRQTVTLKDGKVINESGKYTVILRRTGSDWKVAHAIYNSDQPPMAPAPKS